MKNRIVNILVNCIMAAVLASCYCSQPPPEHSAISLRAAVDGS